MVISGAVPTRRYANRDVANVLVDRLWIDENKAALHSGIDFRDAVALLGISHGSLKEAREVGLLCQQHRSKFKRTLSRTDVDAFASRMRALCRTEGTGEPRCFVALNSLFVRHCLSPKERVQFYRALLDNDVTLRLLGVTFAINQLEMDKDAAEHLLRSLGFWRDSLTRPELMARLGVSVATANALRRDGWVDVMSLRGQDRTCPESVARFEALYENEISVINRLQICPSLLRSQAGLSKFDHLRIKNCVGGVFFARKSMEKTERMLLESVEVRRKWKIDRNIHDHV